MTDADPVATLQEGVSGCASGGASRMRFPGLSIADAAFAMALPSTVFLDTSALAGQQYNFDSTAMRAFMKVARERKLKLLIPDPMEREVQRQMSERIGDLLTSLDLARRKAPFLAGWNELSRLSRLSKGAAEKIGMFAWSQFLGKLETEKLGCSTISASSFVGGHREPASILDEGEKRNGASVASYVAMLRNYSARNGCVTAVISEDPDFKSECDPHFELPYFRSMSALTELFLADHASIGQIRSSVSRSVPLLEEEARQFVLAMPFVHENRCYRVEQSEVHDVAVLDPRIVSIGSGECTLTFSVEVDATHRVRWQMHGDDGQSEISEISATTGTARMTLDPATQHVEWFTSFELDDTALYLNSDVCCARW